MSSEKDILQDENFLGLIWGAVKFLGFVFIGIWAIVKFVIKAPYLYLIGKLHLEHDELWKFHKENHNETVLKLKLELRKKEEEEFNEIKKMLLEVKHDLKQVRQDYQNLRIFISDKINHDEK